MSVDIKRLTAHLSPQQQAAVKKAYRARAESSTTAFISCFFLGVFGAHRFYLKKWRQGFLHLLLAIAIVLVLVGGFLLNQPVATAIIAGILLLLALLWEIVDLVRIDDEVAGHNIKLAEMLIAQTLLSDHAVEQQADAKLESLLHETAAEANAAANYGRMPVDDHTDALAGTLSPNDTAAAPIPAIGAVAAQYVATTVTQISDDPNATQHGNRQSPEAEQQAAPHTESSVETDTVSDLPAEAALSGAALAPLVSEVVTHTHDVSGYSVTDGVETVTTASIPEPPQPDSAAPAAIDPQLLPTSQEANAATWPNYSPVQPEESASRWIAPDVTDRGAIDGDVKPVADIDPAGVLPLHVALDDSLGAHSATDTATDTAIGVGLGAAAFASAAAPLFTQESTPPPATETPAGPPTVAVKPDSVVASPADEGLLFLVPDEAPAASQPMETPAEAYIPPLVPVVSTPETATAPVQSTAAPEPAPQAAPFEAAGAVPAAYEAALAPAPVAYEPPQSLEPQATPQPQPEQHTHSGGETLAELASFAGLASLAGLASSAADEAVSLARAHRESLSSAEATPAADTTSAAPQTPAELAYAEPTHAAPPAEQTTAPQPETLAELAMPPTPAEEAAPEPAPVAAAYEPEAASASAAPPATEAAPEPTAPAEPPVTAEPQPEAVPVAATAAGLAAATDAELLAHHKLKRVRVVRQLKVDGKVVEETSAEEYVDPDADPEPVKARLREQLRQQAQARTNTQGNMNG
ncbi:MAG: NINE protein [Ktedonobacterales bacterium]